ncbi:hypothetical protein DB41_DN00070 [Neochlamydia sp. TUME1]|nr:hypothetical protein DB41_DN00070 [Neochlamydia sp. TUME1]
MIGKKLIYKHWLYKQLLRSLIAGNKSLFLIAPQVTCSEASS